MKIHFDIDITPQELRTFFGLPNIEPLQNEMLELIRNNMSAEVEGFDPATLMKTFLPEHLQPLTTLQQIFWQSLLGQSQTPRDSHNPENQDRSAK